MTVQQLRPAVMATHVASARDRVGEAAALPVGGLGFDELPEVLSELAVLEAQVAALKLAVLAEADVRRVAEEEAASGTDAWAARLTGSTAAVMRGGIWLASRLRETYAATRVAFAAGGINEAQVRVIVNAADSMPTRVTAEQRQVAEEGLVAKAVAGMNARGLRQAARRMLEKISTELADEHEADQLEDEKKKAERETFLALHDNGDGTYSGKFTIPELHGQLLRAYLERLTAPRVWARNTAGEPVEDESLVTGELNRYEMFGLGLLELLEHLPTTGHGPVAATLIVKIDHQHLLDGLAGAGLDTGTRIGAGEARRLACNAGIIPTVLGANSEVLDLGRERRLHSKAQRRALALSHHTCAAEGCERPFAWCEIHHPHPWAQGGRTDLANALPLCGHHHRRAHDDRYNLRYLTSGEVRYRRRR